MDSGRRSSIILIRDQGYNCQGVSRTGDLIEVAHSASQGTLCRSEPVVLVYDPTTLARVARKVKRMT